MREIVSGLKSDVYNTTGSLEVALLSHALSMNNIYYRFIHLAGNVEYGKLPARLRMTVIGSPGIDKADFELLSLAVSAINGCGMCIDSHEKILIKAGFSTNAIQDAVRIASVMHAVAVVLETDPEVNLQAAA